MAGSERAETDCPDAGGSWRRWLALVALLGQIILGAQLFACDLDQDCPDPTGYCPACAFVHRAGPPPLPFLPMAPPKPALHAATYPPIVEAGPATCRFIHGFQSRAPPAAA